MPKNSNHGLAFDALILAFVKVITLSSGIICTMILSRSLGLDDYGTYLQGNIVATLGASLTILGLGDAVNYFFNKDSDAGSTSYVCTVIGLQLFLGFATAIVILAGSGLISTYFSNAALAPLLVYVALRPLCTNLITSLQVLLVSVNKARLLAARNLIMTIVKVLGVCVVSFAVQNIALLLGLLLLIDFITVIWFVISLYRAGYLFNPMRGSMRLLKPILAFSLPMAVYVMCSNVSREIAKLVIGFYESTEQFAIFSNCATVLPLDFISATLLVVLIPVLTRLIGVRDFASCKILFSKYLEIGYLTTISFAGGLLSVNQYTVLMLFGEKYLSGTAVFTIYLFVYMMQFASLSLVLSASGETKKLMTISLSVLLLNAVICPVFYLLFGFLGPAITSVIAAALLTSLLLFYSAKSIKTSVRSLFNFKKLTVFLIQSCGAFCATRLFVVFADAQGWNPYFIFGAGLLLYLTIIGVLNGRKAIDLYKSVNSFSLEK